MKKLFCTICDQCRRVIDKSAYIVYTKNNKKMEFCDDECYRKFMGPKGPPPPPGKPSKTFSIKDIIK
jgi:hypothetical protein